MSYYLKLSAELLFFEIENFIFTLLYFSTNKSKLMRYASVSILLFQVICFIGFICRPTSYIILHKVYGGGG